MLAEKAKAEQLRNDYRNRDMKAMTTEAERLYEQVATQFPDVRSPGADGGKAPKTSDSSMQTVQILSGAGPSPSVLTPNDSR